MAEPRDRVRRAGRSRLRRNKGASATLYPPPPAGSIVVCRDQRGPESARSHPGTAGVRGLRQPDQPRARQEIDDGRRGRGDICGAFPPATAEAFPRP